VQENRTHLQQGESMATDLLSSTRLKSLKEDDIGLILNDGGGLRGRVRKNRAGRLTVQFEFKYRVGSKYRTTKVAQYPDKSLAEIRVVCRAIKAGLSKGIDPIEARKAEKLESRLEQAKQIEARKEELERLAAEAASRRTLSIAIDQWAKQELSRRKDRGEEALRSITKDILPAIGEVSLAEISRSMLVEILDKVVDRGAPVMANHLFGDLRQFFNYAMAREWIETHPLAGLQKENIGGRQRERERYLSESEIIALIGRFPKANLQVSTELAIWIMLSTCCRVGELSRARWDEVDLETGRWVIPASNSKNSKDHTVFLSDFAKSKFESLQTITGSTQWCYPARDEESHIGVKSIAKQIKDRTREKSLKGRSKKPGSLRLSGGDWTPHDLRRTGATMMGELGVIGEVIDRCLNHVEQNKLKRIYQRHELKTEQQEAWKMLGDRLALLSAASANENIVVAQFGTSLG
jgi:integrase